MVNYKKGIKVAKSGVNKFTFNDRGQSKFGASETDSHELKGLTKIHDVMTVEGDLVLQNRLAGTLFGAPQIDGQTAEGQAALQDLKDNAETDYEGFLIYLTNASTTISPFLDDQKFYFCESGTWYPSPFLKVEPGVFETMAANNTGGTVNMPAGEQVVMAPNTTVLDSSGASYTGDIEVRVRDSANASVPGYGVLSQGGSVSSVVTFSPPGATFNPPLDVTIPLNTTPADPNNLAVAYNDGSGWASLLSVSDGTMTYDAATNSVTFQVDSFSSYTIVDSASAAASMFADADSDGEPDVRDSAVNDPYIRFTAHRQHRFDFYGLPTPADGAVATKTLTSADGWLQNSKYSTMRSDVDSTITSYPPGNDARSYTQSFTGPAYSDYADEFYRYTEFDTQPDGNVYTMDINLPAGVPAGDGITLKIGNVDISENPVYKDSYTNKPRNYAANGYVSFNAHPEREDELDANGTPTGLKVLPQGGTVRVQLKHDVDDKIYVRIAHAAIAAEIDIDSKTWIDTDVIDADHDFHPIPSDQFPYDSRTLDSDDDGYSDYADEYPADPSEWRDWDSDNIPDNYEATLQPMKLVFDATSHPDAVYSTSSSWTFDYIYNLRTVWVLGSAENTYRNDPTAWYRVHSGYKIAAYDYTMKVYHEWYSRDGNPPQIFSINSYTNTAGYGRHFLNFPPAAGNTGTTVAYLKSWVYFPATMSTSHGQKISDLRVDFGDGQLLLPHNEQSQVWPIDNVSDWGTYRLFKLERDDSTGIVTVWYADGDDLDAVNAANSWILLYEPSSTTDFDGDGVTDMLDEFPINASETTDTDGDGVGDNADEFPTDPSEFIDNDGDGVGDNADAFDYDPTETQDTDGDYVGDNADAFPFSYNYASDSDGDGVPDGQDLYDDDPAIHGDDDYDGVPDSIDTDDDNLNTVVDHFDIAAMLNTPATTNISLYFDHTVAMQGDDGEDSYNRIHVRAIGHMESINGGKLASKFQNNSSNWQENITALPDPANDNFANLTLSHAQSNETGVSMPVYVQTTFQQTYTDASHQKYIRDLWADFGTYKFKLPHLAVEQEQVKTFKFERDLNTDSMKVWHGFGSAADIEAASSWVLLVDEGAGIWPDSDGDGAYDNLDAFPTDPTETVDTDGDGVGDNSDAFPNDPAIGAMIDNNINALYDPHEIIEMNATAEATELRLSFDHTNSMYNNSTVNSWNHKTVSTIGTLESISGTDPALMTFELQEDHVGRYGMYYVLGAPFSWMSSTTINVGDDQTNNNFSNVSLSHAIHQGAHPPVYVISYTHFTHVIYPSSPFQNRTPDLYVNFGLGRLLLPHSSDDTALKTFKFVRDPATGTISIWHAPGMPQDIPSNDWVLLVDTANFDATSDYDGDGTYDDVDMIPFDPTETQDTDGDWVGDNADAFPTDPTETEDTDGDGVGDNSDAFPTDASETTDTDGDGVGDNSDAFPNDPAYASDSAPYIVLTGFENYTTKLDAQAQWVDPGFLAYDSQEGDISSNVVITGGVDLSTEGTYTINYNVTDVHGNSSAQQTRTVTVVENTNPAGFAYNGLLMKELNSPNSRPIVTIYDESYDTPATEDIVFNKSTSMYYNQADYDFQEGVTYGIEFGQWGWDDSEMMFVFAADGPNTSSGGTYLLDIPLKILQAEGGSLPSGTSSSTATDFTNHPGHNHAHHDLQGSSKATMKLLWINSTLYIDDEAVASYDANNSEFVALLDTDNDGMPDELTYFSSEIAPNGDKNVFIKDLTGVNHTVHASLDRFFDYTAATDSIVMDIEGGASTQHIYNEEVGHFERALTNYGSMTNDLCLKD